MQFLIERALLAMTLGAGIAAACVSIAFAEANSPRVVDDTEADSVAEFLTVANSQRTVNEALPRVISINLCADQMLMLLANDEQIAALSTLSQDASGSYFHEKAHGFAQADNRAEDILPRSPDVVLTGPYTSRYTLSLLEELDLKVEALTIADSFDAMLGNIEKVGVIVRQEARARKLVDSLRVKMADIKRRVQRLDNALIGKGLEAPRAAVYDPNGYTVGKRTVRGEAMLIAGWHNVASDRGIEDYGVLLLEDLIELNPQALVESPYSKDTYSRGQALTKHPALRQSGLDPLIVSLPSNQTICAGPWIIDVIEKLVTAREHL